ncbi:50S ribosomal protein L25/general stress protein Ctc [Syntrophus aciditrophicus]|uniref:Large ribosomal subunit protein bL25 n=1 Tax=Syntrophus aciditrophicus (strain SB) TaxID=56780 RepID=RL25_SYNAS|nr:50S ribosomal protein L25/general stress protein Ctc [Syntrophus aciditrophicus]Q2LUK6.1 RecName: Full=Large ribosomal subunit protein bL25; AltName: Full=50S ribosomal protein L25; AltName: Full=General stress protein CTC [Syntrophus aciditrophicus SB]ABC77765.1 LSU ribosomal protein L25P [Syntrophus aciditrophicus SB]
MEARELKANVRKESGKEQARRMRREGLIPAVLYGPGTDPVSLSVNASDLKTALKGAEENVLIKLIIDDSGRLMEKNSLIRELQIEPLTNNFFHADFYALRMDQESTFDVPIHFEGQPVGIEKGGELQYLKREIKVSCLPSELPDCITVDISRLDVGDAVLIGDLSLSESIRCFDSKDIVLVTIAALHGVNKAEETEEASS